MKIMHTDNFAGDYPDEKFVTELPIMSKEHADEICKAINSRLGDFSPRIWFVVSDDYKLRPGFYP